MTAAAALSEQEPTRAESCEQRNVSREPRDMSRETGEERHRSARRSKESAEETVNDDVKQTTRDET